MKATQKEKLGALYIAVSGFIAGVVNGLLGAGGGILIISAFSKIMKNELPEKKGRFRQFSVRNASYLGGLLLSLRASRKSRRRGLRQLCATRYHRRRHGRPAYR